MLIINADDIGRWKNATDLAITCFKRGRITSASAMVFMEDSERASDLATSEGIDVGLHINLSEKFTGGTVPIRLQEKQEPICKFLGKSKYALLFYHPYLRSQFQYVFQAQYEEFIRLYGRPPSHMDGHFHMHLASNMLFDRIIPYGTKVRRNFSFFPGEKGILNRVYRNIVDSWLDRRYRVTNYFFAMLPYDVARLEFVIKLANTANVELMTHPHVPEEYDFLMSYEYGHAISSVRLGNYYSL
jgi:predicted glycoside hydrolase/deacetylase ChbG (UPF0249 family)